MSKLLETASQEANSGNKDIVNKFRHIGNKFLNAVEISAQEAIITDAYKESIKRISIYQHIKSRRKDIFVENN